VEGHAGMRKKHVYPPEISTNGNLEDVDLRHILAVLEKTSWPLRLRVGLPKSWE
jgi:hypothetical protein